MSSYDAVLLLSYGGPERPDDVIPFLENVVRGKNVPRQRILEVAEHYARFDGVSPINAENRALLTALLGELNAHGPALSVYWGNRYWHPLIVDTLRQMARDGVRRALAFATSPFGSYPGCRAYLEAVDEARRELGPDAPEVDKLRLFYNHPGFIQPTAERLQAALEEIPQQRRPAARIIFTAHSIPVAMARSCPYQHQLDESCQLVAERAGLREWDLVYQSRSGPPSQPWLEPDICDRLRRLAQGPDAGDVVDAVDVVIVPLGFVCEHMEIVYDLDLQAAAVCGELGLNMVRAAPVGRHRRFVRMIRELINERIHQHPTRPALGTDGPHPDQCPTGCCRPS